MIKSEKSPRNLFFVEIIIVLFFFFVSGAVVMKAFATADLRAKKSSICENINLCTQSLCEGYSVKGNIEDTTALVFGEEFSADENGECIIYLSSDCKTVLGSDECIILELRERKERKASGELCFLTVTFRYDGEEIISAEASSYTPKKA